MSELTQPGVYVTVTHVETGEVIRHLGPYDTAAAARTAAGEQTGQPLTWSRDTQTGAQRRTRSPVSGTIG